MQCGTNVGVMPGYFVCDDDVCQSCRSVIDPSPWTRRRCLFSGAPADAGCKNRATVVTADEPEAGAASRL